MTIKSYPQSTANPNVPRDVYLLAEVSLTSGEVVETAYIDRAGNMWIVCDWSGHKPVSLPMFRACRMTGDTEKMIESRWESWFRLHPKAQGAE